MQFELRATDRHMNLDPHAHCRCKFGHTWLMGLPKLHLTHTINCSLSDLAWCGAQGRQGPSPSRPAGGPYHLGASACQSSRGHHGGTSAGSCSTLGRVSSQCFVARRSGHVIRDLRGHAALAVRLVALAVRAVVALLGEAHLPGGDAHAAPEHYHEDDHRDERGDRRALLGALVAPRQPIPVGLALLRVALLRAALRRVLREAP
mmetsp:Transcript_3418/g.11368  ORF Transcript_3418/g.11368 Transcript_3418/m.11368 type:complete len:204 (+) Transcript_3418:436-1047(+)